MEKELVPRAGLSLLGRPHPRIHVARWGSRPCAPSAPLPVAGCRRVEGAASVRPDCVIGVGAYASGPVVAEAAVRGIPSVAVEMDSHMGWTNRILSRLVDRVCLSFPDRESSAGIGATSTSTPGGRCGPLLLAATREEGLRPLRSRPGAARCCWSSAGSLGAHTLNEADGGRLRGVRTLYSRCST